MIGKPHCIVEVTFCVDNVLKFFLFVYNYNTDDGPAEMENKFNKKSSKPETTNAGRRFRAGINKGRKWTDLETKVFCELFLFLPSSLFDELIND